MQWLCTYIYDVDAATHDGGFEQVQPPSHLTILPH